MKNIAISLLVIAIIVGGLIFVSSKQSNTNKENPLDISLKQINSNIEKGSIIIDVRTAEEFKVNHAINSINLPVEDIKKGKLPTISKDKIVYVYCRSGKRASEAKTTLTSAGYTKVVSLTSLKNWIALGGESTDNTGKKCKSIDETSC